MRCHWVAVELVADPLKMEAFFKHLGRKALVPTRPIVGVI